MEVHSYNGDPKTLMISCKQFHTSPCATLYNFMFSSDVEQISLCKVHEGQTETGWMVVACALHC